MAQCKWNKNFNIGDEVHTLKRKRQSDGYLDGVTVIPPTAANCFTNDGFSSTPKKIVARRRTSVDKSSVSYNFLQNSCLEVKSIADTVNSSTAGKVVRNAAPDAQSQNPFEVVRKPPKKKKRELHINEVCFENPALNLELPEKQFNPYEVLRELPAAKVNAIQSNCFVNAALNLRTQDASAARNPFEIQRCSDVKKTNIHSGVDNSGLRVDPVMPTDLKIALSFKPTVGCRIDFSNLPLEQLTPSKLLADKLVFSPVATVSKRSLDSASEESSMDIGRELDRYQLELENSINEAKIRKCTNTAFEPKTNELIQQLEGEQRLTFTQKLEEIVEEDEDKENGGLEVDCAKVTESEEYTNKQMFCVTTKHPDVNGIADILYAPTQNDDVAYASESDEDEVDFKAPAPFVRAYQRTAASCAVGSKESLHSTGTIDSATELKKSLSVRNIIRKSLRKLMHPIKHDDATKTTDAKLQNALGKGELKTERTEKHQPNVAYQIIRNSIRRKIRPKATPRTEEESRTKAEISIIDTSERTMKLKAELLPKNATEHKHTLRSSIRRSTREMGQTLMKSMFHKNHEAYELSN